ncbi:MAG: hypothetical protein QG589_488 [Patescibacteria group bacterium]|nr:hypothetical protein [Patescibacteria group bacterium]
MNLRKLSLSLGVVLVFLGYVTYHNSRLPAQGVLSSDSITSTTSLPVETINNNPKTTPVVTGEVSQPVSVPVSKPTQTGMYRDGIYTGNSIDAYYGNVQVAITISQGKLADVWFVDYPKDRDTSRRINTQAMPLLKTEAIQAQSANVDIIGGATETSGAFQKSLGSALAQAKI